MTALWRPRSSSVGNYLKCLWRAANDRFAVERPGQGWTPAKQDDTTYADHGTCCHFTLQDGIGSRFVPHAPTDDEVEAAAEHFNGDRVAARAAILAGDSRAWQPGAKEWDSAAGLFGGNRTTHLDAVRRVASYAAERMPKSPDGKPWEAEASWELPYLTGHTDFTSQCRTMGGDLKTTARPPDGGEIKDEHLAQVACYYLMTGIPLWWVLYVDSQAAKWSTLVWVDFNRPDRQFYAEQVQSFCQMLMSPLLEQVAYPSVGKHCEKSWCPYELSCAAKIRPPKGVYHDAVAARRLTGRIKSPFDP